MPERTLTPVEAKFGVATAILAAASAFVVAVLKFLPFDELALLPPDLAQRVRWIVAVSYVFIACLIALASYIRYKKDRRRAILISCGAFLIGFICLISLLFVSDAWVIVDKDCIAPESRTQVIAPIEPEVVAAASAQRRLRGSYVTRTRQLMCDDNYGDDISAALAENAVGRRMQLTVLAVVALLGLFSGLTLLLWSLAALQPVNRRPSPLANTPTAAQG